MAAALLDKGKAAYTNKKYDKAAKHFGRARTAATRPQDQLSACDFQVGALVKTKSIEPALAIAKDMIRINRNDARGYIRAAQIERLAERPAQAARWYQHGLKHISRSDPLYPSLQSGIRKCEEQTVQATVQSKPCDPFMTLPIEVARMVLSYLDYRQTTAIIRVSKAWRSFLYKEEPLINTIDFSQARKDVNISALGACLRRLKQYPAVANLSNLTDNAAKDMTGRMPRWFQENKLTKLITSEKIGFSVYHLPTLTNLVHFEGRVRGREQLELLFTCPQLRQLGIALITADASMAILSHEALEHLRLKSLHHMLYLRPDMHLPMLQTMRLDKIDLHDADLTWPALRSLHLTRCRLARNASFSPSMTDLTLEDIYWVGNHQHDSEHPLAFPNLTNMRISLDTWELPLDSVSFDPTKIQTIDITDRRLRDHEASMFLNLTALKRLTIRNGVRLTGVFVKSVIEQGTGKYECIALVNCDDVSRSTSSWAWAQHGVHVQIRGAAEELSGLGGRRVLGQSR